MRDAHGNEVAILLKLGAKKHLEGLRQGHLYLNTLNYFRELEADPNRADRLEGTDHIFQPGIIRMSFDFPGMGHFEVPPEDLAGPVTFVRNETTCCNLYCLYCLREPVNGALFSKEHALFGDSVVLIRNTPEFIARVRDGANRTGLAIWWGPVEYYDEKTYTGKLGRFKKSDRFAYQKEFRFAVSTPGTEPLHLDVGDLSDITSEIIPFDKVDEVLKFSEADANEAGWTW
jgi:hypothetical protein